MRGCLRTHLRAMDLKACGGGAGYQTAEELTQLLNSWLAGGAAYKAASEACRHYMDSHTGAAKQIMERVENAE